MDNALTSVSLRRLQVFLTVCETLHMARAAERLGITQPALSQQIHALEQALGVRLFHRRKRGIDLTDAGQVCRTEAEALLTRHAKAITVVQRTARGEMGRINLGYVGSIMFGKRFPAQVKAIHEAYPTIELSLWQSNLPALVSALETGTVDIALICAPVIVAPPLTYRRHSRQRLVLALPRTHSLAQQDHVPFSSIVHAPMIGLSGADDIGVMQIATRLAAKAGATLSIQWQVPEFSGVLGLVAAGLGYGIVPQCVANVTTSDVVFRPLEDPPIEIEYGLAWNEERATPALHQVIKTLLTAPEEHPSPPNGST